MNFHDRPRAIWALPLLVLAMAMIVLASDWGDIAGGMRRSLFDSYQRAAPRPYQDTRQTSGFAVRVLEIDPASAARFGPWPRTVLARMISKLRAGGAKAVVLAFPLDKPDPLSPMNLAATIPPGPSLDITRQTLAAMPSPDKALAQALAQTKSVTGFFLSGPGKRFVPEEPLG